MKLSFLMKMVLMKVVFTGLPCCDKGPPRNVNICEIERIFKFVFGEELARWPESSLSGKVAQGCFLLAVDSAGETDGVVNECTGAEKKEGNGVEEMLTTT